MAMDTSSPPKTTAAPTLHVADQSFTPPTSEAQQPPSSPATDATITIAPPWLTIAPDHRTRPRSTVGHTDHWVPSAHHRRRVGGEVTDGGGGGCVADPAAAEAAAATTTTTPVQASAVWQIWRRRGAMARQERWRQWSSGQAMA
ncbi:hypothetical protein Dimus_017671 [Dionaea muscipula]